MSPHPIIDLDPLDRLWQQPTHREPLPPPIPRPFDREACLKQLRKLPGDEQLRDWQFWNKLNLPFVMSAEEARFWLVALSELSDNERPLKEVAKQLAESRKVLQNIIKTPSATGKFQAEKELIHVLEDENDWGQAITLWSEYLQHPGLRAVMIDEKAKLADKQYAKQLYFDGFYHYILSNYKYGQTHKDKAMQDRT